MSLYNFYPGPGAVYPQITEWVQEAYQKGYMGFNHRSPEVTTLISDTVYQLKSKLDIPLDYDVYFVSSATESWEICFQNFLTEESLHFFNGDFGEKWHQYTARLCSATPVKFGINESIDEAWSCVTKYQIKSSDLVCLTHNETSNGTMLSDKNLTDCRQLFPTATIAVDATSSMGGVTVPFSLADIWFCSVQKCFGLPAGLGILICSPQAVQKALARPNAGHYNSVHHLHRNHQKSQTTHTPNVLGIFLLRCVLGLYDHFAEVNDIVEKRYFDWVAFFEQQTKFKLLIKNDIVRSKTVLTVNDSNDTIKNAMEQAEKANIILGKGYGQWLTDTFRIANFPAMTDKGILTLQHFLRDV